LSEYQYYEFQAIDRPLSEKDRNELRSLSSRARITSRSFINAYNWGDFRGDPVELMERWFDLHLYFANWGNPRLMIRLPKQLVDHELIEDLIRDVECAELVSSGRIGSSTYVVRRSTRRTNTAERKIRTGWQRLHPCATICWLAI